MSGLPNMSAALTAKLLGLDSPAAMVQTDVLIIGAGLAGLSTALALPKSLNITVFEQSRLRDLLQSLCPRWHRGKLG